MSTFPAMKNADAIKSMCDTDLHLYEEMTNSMLATIFKLADLNLSALKQMTTSYQDALTKLGKDELKAMPRALNMAMSRPIRKIWSPTSSKLQKSCLISRQRL